jgi:hypothetical protein
VGSVGARDDVLTAGSLERTQQQVVFLTADPGEESTVCRVYDVETDH